MVGNARRLTLVLIERCLRELHFCDSTLFILTLNTGIDGRPNRLHLTTVLQFTMHYSGI